LRILGLAEIVPVKILGTLCLIDEGEADWKMIAIAITDPWAPLLNDVTDLETKLPGRHVSWSLDIYICTFIKIYLFIYIYV
jgi:inorganic pyrophosphatase